MNGVLFRARELHADDIAAVVALYGAGTGSVESLPLTDQPEPQTPPDPYPGFGGTVLHRTADTDRDGVVDDIFLAAASGGHLKVFSGASGEEVLSTLAFAGFLGDVELAAEADRVVAVAILPEAVHLRGYVGGVETASVIVGR
jgi:hypothetical protein